MRDLKSIVSDSLHVGVEAVVAFLSAILGVVVSVLKIGKGLIGVGLSFLSDLGHVGDKLLDDLSGVVDRS